MAHVTIEDISRHTGLSRGTVSRALNDRPDISQRTKQRVLEACRKLHYVPNHAARSLATGRHFTAAALVDDLHAGFGTAFLRGVTHRAQSAGYNIHVVELRAAERGADPLRGFSAERIDGLVIGRRLDKRQARAICRVVGERPTVSCWPIEGLDCDVLSPDPVESGRLSARFLLRERRREILYLELRDSEAADERLRGFREICREHGVEPQVLTLEGPLSASSGAALEERLAHIAPGAAIAAADDFLAAGAMYFALRAGRVPGRDIAVLGQGNEPFTARIFPSLSSVDLGGAEIGRRAAGIILDRLCDKRMDAPSRATIPPRVIERDSTRLDG